MTNTNLLKSKMIIQGDQYYVESLMDLLKISRGTASRKLNGQSPFNQVEIQLIAKKYQLTDEEIRLIFFDEKEVIECHV